MIHRLLRNGGWWILDYAYAGYWQVRAALGGRRADDYLVGHRRPILVLPGIYESWQFMRPLIERLSDAGHPVHVVTALQHNRRPVADAADLVAAYLDRTDLRDVMILAHSKGGLIGKYLMVRADRDMRISSMVAVCAPFSGSRYASLMWLPSLRSFSPRNATTVMLGQDVRVNSRITSVFGRFDPHIPEGSELPGARNIRIPSGGHFRILADSRVVSVILDAADEATGARESALPEGVEEIEAG